MENKTHVDENLCVQTKIRETDADFHDIRSKPFEVYGLYRYKTEKQFKRLPDNVGQNTNRGVKQLYTNTAGGRVRFCTNSPYIAIRASMPSVCLMPHMPLLSSAGFDLYENTPDGSISRYRGSFKPAIGITDGYEATVRLTGGEQLRYFTINFPSYSDVDKLEIGVAKGSMIGGGAPYKNRLPIVFYGSSITQGACASRPGNSYENLISQKMGLDYINLGFSGSCKAEKNIAEYMATLGMSVFVSDYDHNSPSAGHLGESHYELYKTIRAAHPDIPYIMISRPDFDRDRADSTLRRDAVTDSYRKAKESGDDNVYFIDGEMIFKDFFGDSCTVDGTHPNDLGFALMARTLIDELEMIMAKGSLTF